MKRIFFMAVLAAQILVACGQSGSRQSVPTVAPENNSAETETEADTSKYIQKLADLDKAEEDLINEYRALTSGEMTPEKENRIKQIFAADDSISDIQKSVILEITRKFKNTTFPARFLDGNAPYLFSYDELKEICDPKSGYFNEPEMKRAKAKLASLEKRHPGLQYKELTMSDMDGNTVRLSNWVGKGKYVLVDFWASWCGPCRQEMPNVVNAYAKYKDKNFEIVGVSFDQRKDSWTSAVKQLGMTWPQMSDLKGWQSAGASTYGINSIPANILFDPQGKIIDLDLRGDALQDRLAEVLK